MKIWLNLSLNTFNDIFRQKTFEITTTHSGKQMSIYNKWILILRKYIEYDQYFVKRSKAMNQSYKLYERLKKNFYFLLMFRLQIILFEKALSCIMNQTLNHDSSSVLKVKI